MSVVAAVVTTSVVSLVSGVASYFYASRAINAAIAEYLKVHAAAVAEYAVVVAAIKSDEDRAVSKLKSLL